MGRAQRMNGTRHGKKFWSDEKENFGFKALQKMGWSPGSGMGKEKQGLTKCIGMVVKNDFAGIGGKNTNVTKHRAIVSMYNDILKKANKPKTEKKTPSLSVEGYMAKNALYRRFRIATRNEFRLKETEVVLPNGKRKKKGFTADDQERIALAQADLKNSGRKGLGFGKLQKPVCIPQTVKSRNAIKKDKKKKKKKKRKLDDTALNSGSVAENFLDGLLSKLKKKKKRQKVVEETEKVAPTTAVVGKKKSKKKKKRKLKDADERAAKRRKIEEPVAQAQPVEPKKKTKRKQRKKSLTQDAPSIEVVKPKKKKKKKKKKQKGLTSTPEKKVENPVNLETKKKKKKRKQ